MSEEYRSQIKKFIKGKEVTVDLDKFEPAYRKKVHTTSAHKLHAYKQKMNSSFENSKAKALNKLKK